MSKVQEVLGKFDDEPSVQDIAATLADNIQLVSIKQLTEEIRVACGDEQVKAFLELLLRKMIPADKEPLRNFFQGREDLISKVCLPHLEN